MPELPEVEVLVRHLAPLLTGRRIQTVEVRRVKSVRPATPRAFARRLAGARCLGVSRRGKYLVFELTAGRDRRPFRLLGHLGMTGRMYFQPRGAPLPKHAAVVFRMGGRAFIYEDPRYFGRLTLDLRPLAELGPEPLDRTYTAGHFRTALQRSSQPVKVKLLDQSCVAGIGNIYASEALFRARIAPHRRARSLDAAEVRRLWRAIRGVLREAIARGSTVPLNWAGQGHRDGLFYYGSAADAARYAVERLRVYDRAGEPCRRCGSAIVRIVQAARSTFYCPNCQRP